MVHTNKVKVNISVECEIEYKFGILKQAVSKLIVWGQKLELETGLRTACTAFILEI